MNPRGRAWRNSLLVRAVGVSLLAACAAACGAAPRSPYDIDYLIAPVPPRLQADDATTLLLDLSEGRVNVIHAADPATAAEGAPRFLNDGGARGAVKIRGKGIRAPQAWTVEMILRVGAEAPNNMAVGAWRATEGLSTTIALSKWWGASLALSAKEGAGMRHAFVLRAYAGGDGRTLDADAPDTWVCVSFGFDAADRRIAAIVRAPDGRILAERYEYAGRERFELGDVPAEQRPNVADECWEDLLKNLAAGAVADLTFGHADVELRRLRISKGFREDRLIPAPVPHDERMKGRLLMPKEIAPGRTKTRRVTRRLGFPGRVNFGTREIEEAYVPISAGDAPITIKLPGMEVGLYSFWLFGTIDLKGRKEIAQVWRPTPMEFEVTDAAGARVGWGRLLLKQYAYPQRMQGFAFHIDRPGDYTATFRLADRAMETAEILWMTFVDCLEDLPNEAVKTSQNIADGHDPRQLAELTAEREKRDDAIWMGLPPLNTHIQTMGSYPQWRKLSETYGLGGWQFKAYVGVAPHNHSPFVSLAMVNAKTGEELSHEDVLAGKPWPGKYGDDGCGIYFPKEQAYAWPRAEMMGRRCQGNYFEYLANNSRYFESGDPEVGHDTAMALVRLAYDWPAVEMNLLGMANCTLAPCLQYGNDYSRADQQAGKFVYQGWSGRNSIGVMTTYDRVFPYIQNNRVFAKAVNRHIPWIKTPKDVVAFLDRWFVFATLRDYHEGVIRDGFVEDAVGQVLGPHKLTEPLFDLTRQKTEAHPASGTFQEMYGTGFSRCGSYYTGSFMAYAFTYAAGVLDKAGALRRARDKGVRLPMDLSDVKRYPKVKAAGDFLIDMFFAGGFPAMIGDASGGPHTGIVAKRRLSMVRKASRAAWELWRDPRHAWLLKHLHGVDDPEVAKAAEGVRNPLLHNVSRVVPDYLAIQELGPDEADVLRKGAVTLRLGIGAGHAHSDFLDLNLFAMGLPMAVDLAARSEGTKLWSRPPASWSFLHNHAIAHDDLDPRKAGVQSGEPWLRAFEPPLMRGSYVDAKGEVRLDRDIVVMDIADGDPATAYVFDLQTLRGGKMHTWCFHGCESREIDLNVPMEAVARETSPWTGRMLKGTLKAGRATDRLTAVWTMTREARDLPHDFTPNGVVHTVACEPRVLGERYDANRPEARVKATLLGHAGEDVLQGSPYSQQYAYAFPFLWVQNPAAEGKASVYPAVYEWYRGETPALKSVALVSRAPVTVKVTTASGQADTFSKAGDALTVVSRDAKGALRWARLSGGTALDTDGLMLKAARAKLSSPVVEIDYAARTLRTKDPITATDPWVTIGNAGRRSHLRLRGTGTDFTWGDDLLIHEGRIEAITVIDAETIEVKTNQPVLFGGQGNRKLEGLTQMSEDERWHFRAGKVIRKPAGAALSKDVFTDANGDGLVHLKTCEIGIGDTVELPTHVDVRRADGGFEVRTNAPVAGRLGNTAFSLEPAAAWQRIR